MNRILGIVESGPIDTNKTVDDQSKNALRDHIKKNILYLEKTLLILEKRTQTYSSKRIFVQRLLEVNMEWSVDCKKYLEKVMVSRAFSLGECTYKCILSKNVDGGIDFLVSRRSPMGLLQCVKATVTLYGAKGCTIQRSATLFRFDSSEDTSIRGFWNLIRLDELPKYLGDGNLLFNLHLTIDPKLTSFVPSKKGMLDSFEQFMSNNAATIVELDNHLSPFFTLAGAIGVFPPFCMPMVTLACWPSSTGKRSELFMATLTDSAQSIIIDDSNLIEQRRALQNRVRRAEQMLHSMKVAYCEQAKLQCCPSSRISMAFPIIKQKFTYPLNTILQQPSNSKEFSFMEQTWVIKFGPRRGNFYFFLTMVDKRGLVELDSLPLSLYAIYEIRFQSEGTEDFLRSKTISFHDAGDSRGFVKFCDEKMLDYRHLRKFVDRDSCIHLSLTMTAIAD